MKVFAILLAAGNSSRFNADVQKQVYLLNGKPVFYYALNTLCNNSQVDEVILVTNESHLDEFKEFVKENNLDAKVILGGNTRQESVNNALSSLEDASSNDIVIIHDAARPLIDDEIISKSIEGAKKYGAVTTAIAMEDTVAVSTENEDVKEFVNRSTLRRIQTPQTFTYSLIKKAHENASNSLATDDCTLVMNLPHKVHFIEGNKKLTKLTTLEDIKYLETFLK